MSLSQPCYKLVNISYINITFFNEKEDTLVSPFLKPNILNLKLMGMTPQTAYFVGSKVPPQVLFCFRLILFCKELVGIPKKYTPG